ncbi:MAG: hypothetical protein DKT66_27160 [Candidatus Melainabacteria bacterium]|nr:MAG: hypothetical protein DKT66_27160 [Candidatus Melainabacteria bacterium]
MTEPNKPKEIEEQPKKPAPENDTQLDPLQYLKEKPPETKTEVPTQFGATPEMFDSAADQKFPAKFTPDKTSPVATPVGNSVERNDAQQLTKVVDAQGRTTTFERGADGEITAFKTGTSEQAAMTLTQQGLVGKNGEKYNEYTLANGQTWRGRIETDKPEPGQVTFTKFEGDGANAVAGARVTHRPDGTTHSEYPAVPGTDVRYSVDTRADGVVNKVTDQNGVEYSGSRLTFDAATGNVSYTSAGGREVTVRPDGSREVVNVDKSRVELDAMGRPTQTFDSNNKPLATYTYDAATGEASSIFVHQANDAKQVGEYRNVDGKWVRPEDNVMLGADGKAQINYDGSYSVKVADGVTERRNTDGSVVTSQQMIDMVNGQQVQVDKVTHVTTADGKNFDFTYGRTTDGKLEVQSVTNREGTWTTDLSKPEGDNGRTYTRTKDGKPVLNDKGQPITWDGKISVNDKGEYSYSTKLENGQWGTVSELTDGTQRIEDPTLSGAIERNDNGQIVRVTNARGETTEFTSWDKDGNPTQFKDYQGKTWTNKDGIWTNNKTDDSRSGSVTVDQHTGDVIFTDFNGKRDISHLDGSRFVERNDGTTLEVGTDGYLKAVNAPGEKKDSPAERFEYTHDKDGNLTAFKMPDGREFKRQDDGTYTDGKTVVKDVDVEQTKSWALGNLKFTDSSTGQVYRYNGDGSETISNSKGQLEQIKQGNGDIHTFTRTPITDDEGNVIGEQTTLKLQNGSLYTTTDGQNWTGTDKGTKPETVRSGMSVIAANDGYLAISGNGHYETYLADGATRLESHNDTTSRSISTDRYGRVERLQDGSGNYNTFEYDDKVPGGISHFSDERGTWKTTDGQKWSLVDQYSEKPVMKDGKPVEASFTLTVTKDSFSQKMVGGDTIEKLGDGKMRVTKPDGMVLNYDSYKDKDGGMQQVLRDSIDQSGKKISYEYTMPGPDNNLTKPEMSHVTVKDAQGNPILVNGKPMELFVRQEDGLNIAYKDANFDPKTKVGEFNVGDNGRPRMTLVDGRTAELQLDGSILMKDKQGKLSGIVGTNTGDMLNNYTQLERDASGQIIGMTKGNERWQATVENGKVTGWQRMTGTMELDEAGKPKLGENQLPVMKWTATNEKANSILVDEKTGAVSIFKDGSWTVRQATGASTESFRTSSPTGSIADIFPDRIINRNEKGEIISTQAGLLASPTKFDDPRPAADRPQGVTGPTFVSNGFEGMQMNKDGTWSKVQLNNKGEWVAVAGAENQKISLQVNAANGDRTWVGADGKPVKIDHANNEKTIFNADNSSIHISADGKTTTYSQAEVNGVKRDVTVGPNGTDVRVYDAKTGETTVMHQDVNSDKFTTRTYRNGVETPESIANPIVQNGKITVNTTTSVGQAEITTTGAGGATRQLNMNGTITDKPPTVVTPEKVNLNAGGPLGGGVLNPGTGKTNEGPVVRNPDGTVAGTTKVNEPVVVNRGATPLPNGGIVPVEVKKDGAATVPAGVDASIKARQEALARVPADQQPVTPVRAGGPQADVPTFEQARNQAKAAADAAAVEAAKKLATANTDLAKLDAAATVLQQQQQKVEASQVSLDLARSQQFLANQQLETLRRDAAALAGRSDLSTADVQRQAEITRKIADAERSRQEALQVQSNTQIAKAEELRVVAETQRRVADQLTSPGEQQKAIAQAESYRQAILQVQAESKENAALAERAKVAVAEANNNALQAQRQVEQRAVETAKAQATSEAQKLDQANKQLAEQTKQVADAQKAKADAQAALDQQKQQQQQQTTPPTAQQLADKKAAEEKLQAATTRLETEQAKLKTMSDAAAAATQKVETAQAAVVAAEKRLEQANTALREQPSIETIKAQVNAAAGRYEQEAQTIRAEIEHIRVAASAPVVEADRREPVVVKQPVVSGNTEHQRDVVTGGDVKGATDIKGAADVKAMPLNPPGQVTTATITGVNSQGQATTADGKVLVDSQGKPIMAAELRNYTTADGKITVVDGKALSNNELSNMSVDQLRGIIANMPKDRVGELALMLPPDKAAQLGLRTDPSVPVNTEVIKQGGQIVVPPTTGNTQDPLKTGTGTGIVVAIDPSKILTGGTAGNGANAGTAVDPKAGANAGTTVDPKAGANAGTTVDPKAGANAGTTVDPKAGANAGTTVDPKTGTATAGTNADPKGGTATTGTNVDPKAGTTANVDLAKGTAPTGTTTTGTTTTADPKSTTTHVDPKTGAVVSTDPKAGTATTTDPKTGAAVTTDPKTGTAVTTDPKTGTTVTTDPKTGAVVATDPKTGAPVATDPKTGTATNADPAKSSVPAATDPKTGAPVATDPKTGQPVATDPKTGTPVATDPKTGQPVATDPKTGTATTADPAKSTTPVTTDPKTGQPVATDPKTGQPVVTDPKTGTPVATDPKTGQPVATDPKTGTPVSADPAKSTTPVTTDPKTGQPVATDPKTGQPVATDPKTGTPVATDPKTGQPVATDPKTGTPVATDPKTGQPVATDPKTGTPVSADPAKSTTPVTTDPKTGQPAATDPKTGTPVATDPKTGQPVATDPKTGTPVATDPKTGAPVATDPKTGTPTTSDPAKSTTPGATDPKTGAPVSTDPKTGTPVSTDPKTGTPVSTDPKTGTPVATDPKTGQPVATDPKAGTSTTADPAKSTTPVATDPKTGAPVATDPKTGTPVSTDPKTGSSVATDPKTGVPIATDPKTGSPVATDPKTGASIATDPKTGSPVSQDPTKTTTTPSTNTTSSDPKAPATTTSTTSTSADPGKSTTASGTPNTGSIVQDPKTGSPVATDPKTGSPVATDPKTGTPISSDPKTGPVVTADPKTGAVTITDPKTGVSVSIDPSKVVAGTGAVTNDPSGKPATGTTSSGTQEQKQNTGTTTDPTGVKQLPAAASADPNAPKQTSTSTADPTNTKQTTTEPSKVQTPTNDPNIKVVTNAPVSAGSSSSAQPTYSVTTDKSGTIVATATDNNGGVVTTIAFNTKTGMLVSTVNDPQTGKVISVTTYAPGEAGKTYTHTGDGFVYDPSQVKPPIALPVDSGTKTGGSTWSVAADTTGKPTYTFNPGDAPVLNIGSGSSSQSGGTFRIELGSAPQGTSDSTLVIRLGAGVKTPAGDFEIQFVVPAGYTPQQGGTTVIMADPETAAQASSGNTKITYVNPDGTPATNVPSGNGSILWTDLDGHLLPPAQSTGTVEVQPTTGNSGTQQQPTQTQPGQVPSTTDPVITLPNTGAQYPTNYDGSQQPQYPINIGNGDVNVGIGINPYTGDPTVHVGLGPIGIDFGGGTPTTPAPVVQPNPYTPEYQPPQQTNTGNVPTNTGSYVDPYGAEHWYDPIGQIVRTVTPDGTNVIYNDDGSRLVYGGNSSTPTFVPPVDNGQIYSGTQVPVTPPITPPITDPYVGTVPNYGTPTQPPVSYGDPLNPGGYPNSPINDPYVPNPNAPGNYTPQPTPPLPFEPVAPTSSTASAPAPATASDPLNPVQQTHQQQPQQNPIAAQKQEEPEDIANKLDVNFEPMRPDHAEPKAEPKPIIVDEKEDPKDSSGSLLSDYENRVREHQDVVHYDGTEGLKGRGFENDQNSQVSHAEAIAMAQETQSAINALIQHLSDERQTDYKEAVQAEDRKYADIAEDIRESKEREDDTYRRHAELIADLKEKEMEGYKQRDEAEREKKEKDEENSKKLTDTVLTALANRRENDAITKARQDAFWAEQQKKEEQVRQDNKQTKYLVRPNDTIESIASKRLRDPKLADLIYQINKDKIEIKMVNGKKVYVVKEGIVLTLPSPRQIREFRQQQRLELFTAQDSSGENVVSIDAKAAADQRRANVEKLLGKIGNAVDTASQKYNVRLGDTLRSVAMKHPQLGDVTLWKLLAEKNGLPTTTDHKGVPTAALRRGTQIVLPTTEEIAQYRDRMRGESITSWSSSKFETASRQCPQCHRLTTTEASSCPGCTYSFNGIGKEVDVEVVNQPLIAASTKTATITSAVPVPRIVQEDVSEASTISLDGADDDNTVVTGGKANSFNVLSENLDPDERKWVEETILNSLIEKLGENCRVVESTSPDGSSIRTQLEVLTGEVWIPILSYEINENTSVRHEFASDGKQRTMPIDLPASAAQELIHNDLQSNWQEYCRKFLAGKRLTA